MAQRLGRLIGQGLLGGIGLIAADAALAAAPPPPPDALTEGQASHWIAGADGATASVADDTSVVRVGGSSLRFDTTGGFDTWLLTPPTKDAGWDLVASGVDGIGYWVRAFNPSAFGFQNNSPWIRLHTTEKDYIELHATSELLNPARFGWVWLFAPLAGNSNWSRIEVGSPDLSLVNWIEIHQDTVDFGFTLWIDELRFGSPKPLDFRVAPDPGQTIVGVPASFRAIVTYENDATLDVTADALWETEDERIAPLVAPGRVAGTLLGSTTISASVGFLFDSAPLVVAPTPDPLPFERLNDLPDGSESVGTSARPEISPDGRFVVYQSSAANLASALAGGPVPPGWRHIILLDRASGALELVSVSNEGAPDDITVNTRPTVSADGLRIAYHSNGSVISGTGGVRHAYLRDRAAGTTVCLTCGLGAGESSDPRISADGRFVAFRSLLALVAEDRNGVADIYRLDLRSGAFELASRTPAGVAANGASREPVISGDGRFIAFTSEASDLVAGDANGVTDVFLAEMPDGPVVRISVGPGGAEADGASNTDLTGADISLDGRRVLFMSTASNLIAGADDNGVRDIFVHDTTTGLNTLVSRGPTGTLGNLPAGGSCVLSGDGRFAFVLTEANNLIPSDVNGVRDLFRYDLETDEVLWIGQALSGQFDGESAAGAAADLTGATFVFGSSAANLVPFDLNGSIDVFLARFEVPSPADLSGDGAVDAADLAILLGNWGSAGAGDLDGDGVVGSADLAILLGGWSN